MIDEENERQVEFIFFKRKSIEISRNLRPLQILLPNIEHTTSTRPILNLWRHNFPIWYELEFKIDRKLGYFGELEQYLGRKSYWGVVITSNVQSLNFLQIFWISQNPTRNFLNGGQTRQRGKKIDWNFWFFFSGSALQHVVRIYSSWKIYFLSIPCL